MIIIVVIIHKKVRDADREGKRIEKNGVHPMYDQVKTSTQNFAQSFHLFL